MFRNDRDRFDKFTEGARKALSLAMEEAQRMQQSYISSEHILLGLLSEDEGIAARVLQRLGVEIARMREVVKELSEKNEPQRQKNSGLTPEGKKIIELAVDEARRLHHHYIGTEHILLGLVRLPMGAAAQTLHAMNIDIQTVNLQTLQMLSQETPPGNTSKARATSAPWFMFRSKGKTDISEKLNEDARKVLSLAQEEAQRFQHNYIGTEHLLLGLVRLEESTAGQILNRSGIDIQKVCNAVEFIIGHGDRVVLGEFDLTPRAKKVIELAVDEAQRLGHASVGSEHLLLGLVREGQGIAAGVLESLGVQIARVRATTLQVVGQGRDSQKLMIAYISGEKPLGSQTSGVQDADDLVPEPASAEEQGDTITIRARRVLARAREEARHYQQEHVGTEHLLLSLVREQNGLAFHVLRNQGIEIERILTATQFLIVDEKLSEPWDTDGLTTDCKKTIALAIEEAWQMRHSTIGTEHLLLGLVRGEGIASGILITRGLTLDKARAEIRRLMGC